MLLLLSVALADALPMPTLTCPRGARVSQDHGNEYCSPARCGDRCEGSCEPLGLCVEKQTLDCGGEDPDCRYDAMVVHGACEVDADCSAGRCMVEDRCVPGGVEAALHSVSEAGERCGCGAGVGSAWLGALLLLFTRRRA